MKKKKKPPKTPKPPRDPNCVRTQFKKGVIAHPATTAKLIEKNPGNKNAMKLNTPELRKEVFRQYCEWISHGWSRKSFVFDHPDISITWETVEKYMRDFPEELNENDRKVAEAVALKYWESQGVAMMTGQMDKCEPAIYQMMMRNKFGWDKHESKREDTLETDVKTLLKRLESMEMHEVISIPPQVAPSSPKPLEIEAPHVQDFEEVEPSSTLRSLPKE